MIGLRDTKTAIREAGRDAGRAVTATAVLGFVALALAAIALAVALRR